MLPDEKPDQNPDLKKESNSEGPESTGSKIDQLISSGFYAKKQLYSKFRLLAWSHASRFEQARKIIRPIASGRLLDYGCGDGTFIAKNLDLFSEATGLDPDQATIADLKTRFATVPKVSFIEKLTDPKRYDVIVCMEVFEHCLPQTQERILIEMREALSEKGHLLISVPIEIGLPLVLKQLGRRIASFLKIKHYQYMETYSMTEFARAFLATKSTYFDRTVYAGGQIGHKGFNWRYFKTQIERHFEVTLIRYSPVHWLGSQLGAQVFFLCQKK